MTQIPEFKTPPAVTQNVPPSPPPLPLVYGDKGAGQYVPTQDERTMAMLAWLLGIVSGWIGPLIIWLVKREQSRFVDFHGKQALIVHIAAFVLMVPLVLFFIFPFIGCLAIPPLMLLGIGLLVLQILVAVKANSGEWYRVPLVGSWS